TRNKFQFTGEALDPGTGLYYLRARYYEPNLGRFLERDPLEGSLLLHLSRNPYQYGLSNPIRYADPTGLSSIDGRPNVVQQASLISTIRENVQMIAQSLLKIACSAILPFCGTAVGLEQVKEDITSIQQTERQQLDSAVKNCVGLFDSARDTAGCVYSQF